MFKPDDGNKPACTPGPVIPVRVGRHPLSPCSGWVRMATTTRLEKEVLRALGGLRAMVLDPQGLRNRQDNSPPLSERHLRSLLDFVEAVAVHFPKQGGSTSR